MMHVIEDIEKKPDMTKASFLERLVRWLRGPKCKTEVKACTPEGKLLGVDDEVVVYDRYRFAIPLPGIIVNFSTSNDVVEVRLLKSNNTTYPVGRSVWVHNAQLKLAT